MTSGGGSLAALLELEQRIAREIAAARAEAEGRVEAAREQARRLESDEGGLLEAALASLRDSIEDETAAEIEQLERAGRVEAERYHVVDEETLRGLARSVVARITAVEPAT